MTKKYVISLPVAIPDELFAGRSTPDYIAKKIDYDYSGLPRIALTEAESPRDALGHFFTRELGSSVDPRGMINIFSSEAHKFAFEVPEKHTHDAEGKKLYPGYADTFQRMELAIAIADARNCRPEDCFSEASKLIALIKKR